MDGTIENEVEGKAKADTCATAAESVTPARTQLRTQSDVVPMTKSRRRIKYPLGSDVDGEIIFDFPFIIDDETVSFIKEHGQIMFIVRGPPSTGKAMLSDMLTDLYPSGVLCCADHYFSNTFDTVDRNKETLKLSHKFCEKKVKQACRNNANPVIVQNTHMRKWEMQMYLDFAALFNYTVVMAITLYRYDVTAKGLAKYNPDGLSYRYMKMRLQQWEDVLPMLTGWFICPEDSAYLLSSLITSLNALTDDGKFCRIFDVYDVGGISKYFKPRRLLYCLAGYSDSSEEMGTYYFSDEVQDNYGKCFTITIQGYLVSSLGVMSIVKITDEMQCLILSPDNSRRAYDICDAFEGLTCKDMGEYEATTVFPSEYHELGKTISLESWEDGENLDLEKSSLIFMAEGNIRRPSIKDLIGYFKKSLRYVIDQENNDAEERGVCRLPYDAWFIPVPKKIKVKTIFTGLYL